MKHLLLTKTIYSISNPKSQTLLQNTLWLRVSCKLHVPMFKNETPYPFIIWLDKFCSIFKMTFRLLIPICSSKSGSQCTTSPNEANKSFDQQWLTKIHNIQKSKILFWRPILNIPIILLFCCNNVVFSNIYADVWLHPHP